MIYNKLAGEELAFAKENQVFTEFTKRNLAQRGRPLKSKLDMVAGNRSHGFASRRTLEDPVAMITAMDGSYKSKGNTKSKKNGGHLAHTSECKGRDTLAEDIKAKAEWKAQRKRRKKAARRSRA